MRHSRSRSCRAAPPFLPTLILTHRAYRMSLIGYVTRIHFADRVLEDALPEELRTLGVQRPLVLTDAAGEADEGFERLADLLPARLVPLRHVDTVLAQGGRARVRAIAADSGADAVIGLGGHWRWIWPASWGARRCRGCR